MWLRESRKKIVQLAFLFCVALSLTGCWGIAFSPDGRWLTFIESYGPAHGLLTMDLKSRRVKALPDTEEAYHPGYSPNSKYLAFVDKSFRLIVQDVGTGRRKTVAKGCSGYAWSADSRQVIAICSRVKAMGVDALWCDIATNKVVARRTSEDLQITGPIYAMALPGRDGLVYATSEKAFLVTKSEIRRLRDDTKFCGGGVSPDGRSVLLAARSDDPQKVFLKLFRYDLATRQTTALPFPAKIRGLNLNAKLPVESVLGVVFSPDAKRLVVLIRRAEKRSAMFISEAYSLRLDGTDVVELVKPGLWGGILPAWSPTGKMALLTTTFPVTGSKSVVTVDVRQVDGRQPQVLYQKKASGPRPRK